STVGMEYFLHERSTAGWIDISKSTVRRPHFRVTSLATGNEQRHDPLQDRCGRSPSIGLELHRWSTGTSHWRSSRPLCHRGSDISSRFLVDTKVAAMGMGDQT